MTVLYSKNYQCYARFIGVVQMYNGGSVFWNSGVVFMSNSVTKAMTLCCRRMW